MGQDFLKAFMGMNGPSIRDQVYRDSNLGRLEASINKDYRLFKKPYDFKQRGVTPEEYENLVKKYRCIFSDKKSEETKSEETKSEETKSEE